MVIDAHQHFWKYNPVKHGWIDDRMSMIRRDFLPEDLHPLLSDNSVDACVAIQADQTLEENDFLVNLSQQHSFIKGVVGWVDFRKEHVKSDLERYSDTKVIKGFRHVVQGEADPNFLLRTSFLNGISLLEAHNYTYDILVFPHQLGSVLDFVGRFPNQKFIIDHLAKPYIKDGFIKGWATLILEIAKHENVYCKVSGMVTEADYEFWNYEQLQPYLDVVLKSFGPSRLVFGSDWPVCLVAAKYSKVKKTLETFIASLSQDEQHAIMGLNAMTFYNL